MDNQQIAKEILELLGGKKNIRTIGNCYTRVRTEVEDTGKCRIEELKKLEVSLGVVTEGNQVQIVVGPGKSAKLAGAISELAELQRKEYDEAEVRKAENRAKNQNARKSASEKDRKYFHSDHSCLYRLRPYGGHL